SDRDTVNNFLNCETEKRGSFAFRGDLYPDILLRWRGNTSCLLVKKNWNVRFNRVKPLPEGAKALILNALWTDKACVREYLAWDFVREVGSPYCKTEYVRLHFNGDYFGLYHSIEHTDSRFLKRNGLDSAGNLYKAKEPPRVPGTPIGIEAQP